MMCYYLMSGKLEMYKMIRVLEIGGTVTWMYLMYLTRLNYTHIPMAEMVDKGAWRAPVTQDGCSSLEWLTNDHVAPGTEGCVLSTCHPPIPGDKPNKQEERLIAW